MDKERNDSVPDLYLAVGVVAFCVAVGGLGLHLERGQSKPLATLPPSSKEYVVKLNGAITPSSAGIIVALADGLFGRGGLSVSLLSGSGDADAIASDNLTETNAVTRMEPSNV